MGVSSAETGIIVGVALAFALVIGLAKLVLGKLYPAKAPARPAAEQAPTSLGPLPQHDSFFLPPGSKQPPGPAYAAADGASHKYFDPSPGSPHSNVSAQNDFDYASSAVNFNSPPASPRGSYNTSGVMNVPPGAVVLDKAAAPEPTATSANVNDTAASDEAGDDFGHSLRNLVSNAEAEKTKAAIASKAASMQESQDADREKAELMALITAGAGVVEDASHRTRSPPPADGARIGAGAEATPSDGEDEDAGIDMLLNAVEIKPPVSTPAPAPAQPKEPAAWRSKAIAANEHTGSKDALPPASADPDATQLVYTDRGYERRTVQPSPKAPEPTSPTPATRPYAGPPLPPPAPVTAWVNPAVTPKEPQFTSPGFSSDALDAGKKDWTVKPTKFSLGSQDAAPVKTHTAAAVALPKIQEAKKFGGPAAAPPPPPGPPPVLDEPGAKTAKAPPATKPFAMKAKAGKAPNSLTRLQELEAESAAPAFQIVKFKKPKKATSGVGGFADY